MSKKIRFTAVLAILFVLGGLATVHASGIASARQGRVVDIQYADATPNQVDDQDRYGSYRSSRYDDSYQRQPERSYAGTAIGGAVGAIIGSVAGRHSSVGRAVGGFGLAAIGGALGNEVDQRRYERKQDEMRASVEHDRYSSERFEQRSNSGAQVIVSMGDGQRTAARSLRLTMWSSIETS
jgi:uncharacterized protein YcfJ